MLKVFNPRYESIKNPVSNFISNFNNEGRIFGNGNRNTIRLIEIEGLVLNVKSFKIPNLINKIVYKFFRKSKARRSFEYARKLMQMGIGTPNPIAYYELATPVLFKKSFYISEHLDCDLTYRELTKDLNYPNHEDILRAFTRFTYHLHENNVNFLDHSPGNTLIQINNGNYKFYLVDLNRMVFKPMNFETRIRNFSRLTIHKSMVKIMSDEYSKSSGEDYTKIFQLMWKSTETFQEKHKRKRYIKKKLKFWENS